jgi:hypothetical protein
MKAYIKNNNGALTPAENSSAENRVFCGYYAAMGYNGERPGDLFAVLSGPVLVPAYNVNGERLNVGKSRAGMSYNTRLKKWYNG